MKFFLFSLLIVAAFALPLLDPVGPLLCMVPTLASLSCSIADAKDAWSQFDELLETSPNVQVPYNGLGCDLDGVDKATCDLQEAIDCLIDAILANWDSNHNLNMLCLDGIIAALQKLSDAKECWAKAIICWVNGVKSGSTTTWSEFFYTLDELVASKGRLIGIVNNIEGLGGTAFGLTCKLTGVDTNLNGLSVELYTVSVGIGGDIALVDPPTATILEDFQTVIYDISDADAGLALAIDGLVSP